MTSGRLFRIAVAVALCLLSWHIWAEDQYITDKKGCKVANPNPKPKESVVWSGACVDGFAHGEGVMQWRVDDQPAGRYEGNLTRGVVSGKGKLIMPDGTSYEGEWKDGRPDGEGLMTDASGETLKGRWKEGVYTGPEPGK